MHDRAPQAGSPAPPACPEVVVSLLDESRLRRIVDEQVSALLAELEARLVERLAASPKEAAVDRGHASVLTEREVAELLHLHPRTIRRLEQSGDPPAAMRIGGSKRFVAKEIRDWLGREQVRARRSA
jgi:predicted DNA-binding transcriptional regulator AlpA